MVKFNRTKSHSANSMKWVSLAFVLGLIIGASGVFDALAYQLNYAFDDFIGVAKDCDGSDYAYEVLQCKYDYSLEFTKE